MQHAGINPAKDFSPDVCREGSERPLLAWPLACGSKIAERATALTFVDGHADDRSPGRDLAATVAKLRDAVPVGTEPDQLGQSERLDFVIGAPSR